MPREGRIFTRRWDDRDWLALPIDAQWLYDVFISQASINHAGVLPIPRHMWANLASDEDAADRIHAALKTLVDRAFVALDDATDELLVRTLIRNDVLDGPPGPFLAAMARAVEIRSPHLRAILYAELLRMDPAVIERKGKPGFAKEKPIAAYRRALGVLEPGPSDPPPDAGAYGIDNAMPNGLGGQTPPQASDRGRTYGIGNAMSYGPGVGVGVGVGEPNALVEINSSCVASPHAPAPTPAHTPAREAAARQGQDPPPRSGRNGLEVVRDTGTANLPAHIQAELAEEPQAPAPVRQAANATVRAMTLFDEEAAAWPVKPVGRERGRWVHAVAQLLAEGIPAPAVMAGMRACSGKGCGPRLLDSFVFGEANRRGPESRADRNTKAILSRITPDGGPSLAELEAAEEAERAALALQRRKAIEGG